MQRPKRPRPHICKCGKDYCFIGALKTHQQQCLVFLKQQQDQGDTLDPNPNPTSSHFHTFSCQANGDKSPNPKRVLFTSNIGLQTPEISPTNQPLSDIVEIEISKTQSEKSPSNLQINEKCIESVQHQIIRSSESPQTLETSEIEPTGCSPLELEKFFCSALFDINEQSLSRWSCRFINQPQNSESEVDFVKISAHHAPQVH